MPLASDKSQSLSKGNTDSATGGKIVFWSEGMIKQKSLLRAAGTYYFACSVWQLREAAFTVVFFPSKWKGPSHISPSFCSWIHGGWGCDHDLSCLTMFPPLREAPRLSFKQVLSLHAALCIEKNPHTHFSSSTQCKMRIDFAPSKREHLEYNEVGKGGVGVQRDESKLSMTNGIRDHLVLLYTIKYP